MLTSCMTPMCTASIIPKGVTIGGGSEAGPGLRCSPEPSVASRECRIDGIRLRSTPGHPQGKWGSFLIEGTTDSLERSAD